MNLKPFFYMIIMGLLFSACMAPAIVTINQETVDTKYSKVYDSSLEKVMSAITETITELKWVKLEEHRNVLKRLESGQQKWELKTKKAFYSKSDYKYSWNVVAPKTVVDDLIFLKLRTPISLTSYGAQLYLGISLKKSQVTVKYSASTNQSYERAKLLGYLSQLSQAVDNKLRVGKH